MTINAKKSNILMDDLIECGRNMDLKLFKCKKIVEEVMSAVKVWQTIAYSVGIREKTIN